MEWRHIMQDQKWRGRIADCNGSIEQVGARAERYHSIENVAAHQRTTVEEKRQYEHKVARDRVLKQFRVQVKERVRRRERSKGSLVQNGLLPNSEYHDNIGKNVLSQSSNDDVTIVTERSRTKDDAYKQLAIYCCATSQIDEEEQAASAAADTSMSASTASSQQQLDTKSTIEQGTQAMDAVLTTQTLNELNQLQRGDKVSMTHRLYSQRERQQSREWVVQQQQQHQAWLHREARELERRLVEGRKEKPKVQDESTKQWTVEEQRKKSEQHAEELKRYCEALYQQRRRKQYRSPSPPPSLCSCHSSLWECNPVFCAANCIYRQDHSAYNRALHSFLHSLNT